MQSNGETWLASAYKCKLQPLNFYSEVIGYPWWFVKTCVVRYSIHVNPCFSLTPTAIDYREFQQWPTAESDQAVGGEERRREEGRVEKSSNISLVLALFPCTWRIGEECLASTICECAAPQVSLGNLETAADTSPCCMTLHYRIMGGIISLFIQQCHVMCLQKDMNDGNAAHL